MTSSRWKIIVVCFWVFICVMLLWQFITYNQGLDRKTADNPDKGHYFFYQTNTSPVAPPPQVVSGPKIKQIGFSVDDGVPNAQSFTCHVTVQNIGNAKAVNIHVMVHPYRGVQLTGGEISLPGQADTYVQDNDALGQVGEWLGFPDLAPGEKSTQKIEFLRRPEASPGSNDNPEITFDVEKPKP